MAAGWLLPLPVLQTSFKDVCVVDSIVSSTIGWGRHALSPLQKIQLPKLNVLL